MGSAPRTDQRLLQDFYNGDDSSLGKLVTRYKDKVYNSIVIMVKDPSVANDLFQDTFFKIFKTLKAGKYKDDNKFGAWAVTIAHHVCMDYFRRRPALELIDPDNTETLDEIVDCVNSTEQEIVQEEMFECAVKLLKHLPKEQREVLVLRFFGKMTFKEISETTGYNLNTCLGRMHNGILNLRKLIKKHGILL